LQPNKQLRFATIDLTRRADLYSSPEKKNESRDLIVASFEAQAKSTKGQVDVDDNTFLRVDLSAENQGGNTSDTHLQQMPHPDESGWGIYFLSFIRIDYCKALYNCCCSRKVTRALSSVEARSGPTADFLHG
jgi:hypothetical protein